MAKQLRDKLITFTVYANGSEEFGVAEVSLPDLEFITSTIKGGGLAGELEVPTLGQLKSMKATITWQIVEKSLSKFARQRYHQVEFRGAQQTENTETGDLQVSAVSVQVGGWVTKTSMGNLLILRLQAPRQIFLSMLLRPLLTAKNFTTSTL